MSGKVQIFKKKEQEPKKQEPTGDFLHILEKNIGSVIYGPWYFSPERDGCFVCSLSVSKGAASV